MGILNDWFHFQITFHSSCTLSLLNANESKHLQKPYRDFGQSLWRSNLPAFLSEIPHWWWVRFPWLFCVSFSSQRKHHLLQKYQSSCTSRWDRHWSFIHLHFSPKCPDSSYRQYRGVLQVSSFLSVFWVTIFYHRYGADFWESNQFRSYNWRCWRQDCCRRFPPDYRCFCMYTWGRCW